MKKIRVLSKVNIPRTSISYAFCVGRLLTPKNEETHFASFHKNKESYGSSFWFYRSLWPLEDINIMLQFISIMKVPNKNGIVFQLFKQ